MDKQELLKLMNELGIDVNQLARGSSDIPDLKLSVIQEFMSTFMSPPELVLSKLFGSSDSPSSSIKWESQRGGRGMTPFVAPGSPAPTTAPFGFAKHEAEAAYWKEKMYFDEEFLNNLRKPGTEATYHDAQSKVATNLASLSARSDRRLEWMFSQMLTGGTITYEVQGGYKNTLDYQIPSEHRVSLTSSYYWDTGGSRNIMKDIQDAKILVNRACGGKIDYAIFNSQVLKHLANDTTIRQLLQKNYFGDGDLFSKGNLHDLIGVNARVIGNLLDIDNFMIYDQMYEIRAWLTAAVTGASTTWISLDKIEDFSVGEKLRFNDQSAGTYEERYIISIDVEGGRVQVAYPPASSYKASEDFVTMTKPFIPDDKFIMFASKVDGQPIAGYKRAPFGLERHYGKYTDKKTEWDPEGLWVRVQDKGLPVLLQRDAVYILDVTATTGQSATTTTTTTTTTTSSTTTTTA